jgi:hypothetical protein
MTLPFSIHTHFDVPMLKMTFPFSIHARFSQSMTFAFQSIFFQPIQTFSIDLALSFSYIKQTDSPESHHKTNKHLKAMQFHTILLTLAAISLSAVNSAPVKPEEGK